MDKNIFTIPCVILCGGKSSRMKEDKSLLPFVNKKTLSQYQYDRLSLYFSKVFLSSKHDKFDFLEDKTALILDKSEVFSPIVALKSIVDKIQTDKFFLIAVDTPMVNIDSIKKLIQNSKNHQITVAKTEKTHFLCGVFSTDIKVTLKEMLEKDIHKVSFLLDKSSTNIVEFWDDKEFINLNYKQEYLSLKSSLL